MKYRKKKSWILVIDSLQARIFDETHTNPEESEIKILPTDNVISESSRGRVFDRFGSGRHVVEEHFEQKIDPQVSFVRQIIDYLQHAFNEKRFVSLIIISPPKMLGILRKFLPQKLKDKVITELNHDLTHYKFTEIKEYLAKYKNIL